MSVGRVVLPSMGASTWSAEAVVCDLVALCFAAFVAWLAFFVFDTNAGIAASPRRWRALEALFAAWCVGLEIFTAVNIWRAPAEYQEFARFWLSTFAESGHPLARRAPAALAWTRRRAAGRRSCGSTRA